MKRDPLKSMLLVAAMLASTACSSDAATSTKTETKPEAKADAKAQAFANDADAKSPAPDAVPQSLTQALERYESIRSKLAADDGALQDDAGALASAAREAKRDALAAAADSLTKLPAEDLAALRKQFGEVSKEVVKLIAETPALQEGRHVFACPMAQGYQKWVQREEKMANPYMGTKMLECGSASEWKT
ncbi:MAG: DUF3347 domain-containing protein [Myxococcales bacterium]|nr:DUF3347 domain-containing protein [Myxococcales bacterium]